MIRSLLELLEKLIKDWRHIVLYISHDETLIENTANVLILDEPTRNFSPLSGPVIRKMIASFPGAVISISHDRKYIEEVCATTYTLTEEGLNKEYFTRIR